MKKIHISFRGKHSFMFLVQLHPEKTSVYSLHLSSKCYALQENRLTSIHGKGLIYGPKWSFQWKSYIFKRGFEHVPNYKFWLNFAYKILCLISINTYQNSAVEPIAQWILADKYAMMRLKQCDLAFTCTLLGLNIYFCWNELLGYFMSRYFLISLERCKYSLCLIFWDMEVSPLSLNVSLQIRNNRLYTF